MKLKLNKETVVALSSGDLNTVRGGLEKRSDIRTGDCRWSRRHKVDHNDCGTATGCSVS